ncbi:MAG: 4Fe-4S binding protein [Oscillospiraceae bacterium]|nr:4Fe-4S binding protein [Oscillospiraceae bacterium]
MIYVKDANLNQGWKDVTEGGTILQGGTSMEVNTGDWRIMIPGWVEENCKHCFLCFPVCADSSIIVKDGKREDFDFGHCKGCGVCYKVCPFNAITFEKEDK